MSDQEPVKQPNRKVDWAKVLEKVVSSQILSVFLDSMKPGPFEKPPRNTFPRLCSAAAGAFLPLCLGTPVFLYLGAPKVFNAFIEWFTTIVISVNIAAGIILLYILVMLLVSTFIGFVVSNSTSERATLSEMTFHGFKFTLGWAIRFCLFLLILVLFQYILGKMITDGPLWWKS
jgi:hypothetical protein